MSNKKAVSGKTANQIVLSSDVTTMSSVEISKLTGKRHDNVIRDIEKMLNELEIDALKFEEIYSDDYSRKRKCYSLPKREVLILVSGYNLKMRAAIIDRWQELESAAPALPQTLPEALRLYADAVEENQALKPKAEALERLNSAVGNYCLRDAAKQLDIGPKKFNKWLESNDWCFINGNKQRVPRQRRIDSGVMATRGGSNNGHSFVQPLITPKGLAKLAVVFGGDE